MTQAVCPSCTPCHIRSLPVPYHLFLSADCMSSRFSLPSCYACCLSEVSLSAVRFLCILYCMSIRYLNSPLFCSLRIRCSCLREYRSKFRRQPYQAEKSICFCIPCLLLLSFPYSDIKSMRSCCINLKLLYILEVAAHTSHHEYMPIGAALT